MEDYVHIDVQDTELCPRYCARIVKNVLRAGNAEGRVQQDFYGDTDTPYRLVNNKVIVPTADEQARNPRSRSAKLRIAEKK